MMIMGDNCTYLYYHPSTMAHNNDEFVQMYGAWYEAYWRPVHFERPELVWFDFVEVWSPTDDPGRVDVKAYGSSNRHHERYMTVQAK